MVNGLDLRYDNKLNENVKKNLCQSQQRVILHARVKFVQLMFLGVFVSCLSGTRALSGIGMEMARWNM